MAGKSHQKMDAAVMCIVFCIVSFLIGVVLAYAGFITEYKISLLNHKGVSLIGYVTAMQPTGKSPSVTYSFKDKQGVSYDNSDSYPNFPWKTIQVGSAVSVTYDSENPTVNMLTGRLQILQRDDVQKMRMMIMALPFAFSALFFGLYRFLRAREKPAVA